MNVNIKKLKETANLPHRGSACAAGYDLYACIDETQDILAHCTAMIGTGLAIEIPDGYFGAIFARSGLASKKGLRPANCVGVVDSDYRGEVMVALHNDTEFTGHVDNGERIAQLVIMPYLDITFTEVNDLSSSERGEGGFGSTGKN